RRPDGAWNLLAGDANRASRAPEPPPTTDAAIAIRRAPAWPLGGFESSLSSFPSSQSLQPQVGQLAQTRMHSEVLPPDDARRRGLSGPPGFEFIERLGQQLHGEGGALVAQLARRVSRLNRDLPRDDDRSGVHMLGDEMHADRHRIAVQRGPLRNV